MLLPITAVASAAESCTLDKPLALGLVRPLSTINTVVLHHTGLPTVGGSVATLRRRGLSYHYIVDVDGRVIQGVPVRRIALHAAGANRRSIGISFVGGMTSEWVPEPAQLRTVKQLVSTLARAHPSIRYVIGHGDVRDTNRGEPFGIDFAQFLAEVQAEQHVRLSHPENDQEPLRGYRLTALRLLEHPLVPKQRTPPAQLAAFESVTCGNGKKVRYPVPPEFRGAVARPTGEPASNFHLETTKGR